MTISTLTPRERQTLTLLASGASRKVIGQTLGISPWTVKNYTESVRLRLGVRTNAEAIVIAVKAGVV